MVFGVELRPARWLSAACTLGLMITAKCVAAAGVLTVVLAVAAAMDVSVVSLTVSV